MINVDHEATAKALLPCHSISCGVDTRTERMVHYATCPAYYRIAVAAALAELKEDNEEWLRMSKRKDAIIDADIKELAQLRAKLETLRNIPVDCLLDCPKCGEPHIDKPQPEKGWTNPPHRTHQCQYCGHLWRAYETATNGIENPLRAKLAEAEARVVKLETQAATTTIQVIGQRMIDWEVDKEPLTEEEWREFVESSLGCSRALADSYKRLKAEVQQLGGIHRHADCIGSDLGCRYGELNDACVKYLLEIDRLRTEVEQLKEGYQLSNFSSKGCPGCEYREGVFIKHCVLHQEQEQLRAEVETWRNGYHAFEREVQELKSKLARAEVSK